MRAILLFIALSGCGGTYDQTGGYGSSYDEAAADGLRVRYANTNPPRVGDIDRYYAEVAQCMGISPAPSGPLVIIDTAVPAKLGSNGYIFYPETIVIDAQITTFEWPPSEYVASAAAFPFKHEMIHYLKNATDPDFTIDRQNAHDSPFFALCGH